MEIIAREIQDYAEKYSSDESPVLSALRRKTNLEREDKNMLSGFYQGRFLSFISKMLAPRRILEIGTYTGYSALCLAEGLKEDGKIITIDIEPETGRIAKEFWSQTVYENHIDARLGNALEIVPALEETFDLVFIDADKANYSNYFDAVFPKTRKGGLIIADNVLWSGAVLEVERGAEVRKSTEALHAYNRKIDSDPKVSNLLLAIRDGLMIARKEKD